MSLFYPITRRRWLKNRSGGFPNYVSDVESTTKKRINKNLTYLQKNQDTLITDGDIVNTNMKRNIYINARIGKALFTTLLVLFMLFESILNYQNMQIAIMPGQDGLLPLLARIPTAFGLTAASFIFAHMSFEILLHSLLESDKAKYNFPDTNNVATLSDKIEKKAGISQLALLAINLILLGFALYAIYLFSQSRGRAFGGESNDLTILALLIPPAGGILGFFIKKNHNIVIAYKSMMRYRRIIDIDKKNKNLLVDSFSLKRAKTLNHEIANSYKKVIRFRNYLEALNYKQNGNGSAYSIPNNLEIDNQNQWRERIKKILEPETLRYYNNSVNNNING